MTKQEEVSDLICGDEDLLFADGLDGALIGVVERFGMEPIALYDRDKVIETFMADCGPGNDFGAEDDDEQDDAHTQAEEHYGFNVIGAWVGDRTPAYAKLLPRPELSEKASSAAKHAFLRSDSDYQTTGAWATGRNAWEAAIKWAREQNA